MNKLYAGFQAALATMKSIPTVWRQSDQFFWTGGGRVNRITGGLGAKATNAEIYSTHVWAYAAINAIARNIAGVPFVFQTVQGPIKQDSKLAQFFEKPNPFQGFGQLMESMISWIHLNGDVILVMRRKDENSIPEEMMAVNADPFEPVFNKNGTIAGWVMDNPNGGEKIPFRKHEIIHIKFWNPNDTWRGLSPLLPARSGIHQDFLADQFNSSFFENSGSPSGVIEIEQNLTDPEFERVVKQYEDKHVRQGQAHKMLILEGGAKFKPTIFTQKDMEFLNQKKWNRDATLAAFGVPKMEVGIIEEGANLAVIKMQSREFWLKNLIPKMNLIEWHLWSQLFSKISGGRVWAEFDTSAIDALQDEFHEKVATGRSLWEMGYTSNQINKRLTLGLPENKWQNIGYKPTQIEVIAVDADGTPIAQDVENPGADPLRKPATGVDTKPNEGQVVKPEPTPAATSKPAFPAVADPGTKAAIALLSSKLQRFFFKQRSRQLKALELRKSHVLENADEQHALKSYLSERAIATDCKELQQTVHNELLVCLIKNFSSADTTMQEVKRLYNKIDKAMPMMAEALLNRD
jgi:HK97 family phage portal protein